LLTDFVCLYTYEFWLSLCKIVRSSVILLLPLFESFTVATMTWLTDMGYLCHKWPRICSTCREHFPVLSSFMTYHRFVTRLTRQLPLVDRNCLPFRGTWVHPGFSGVRVTRSLVLCVCFVDRCLSFCTFSFGHCVVCSSSIYGFWLPLWYLQTFPTEKMFDSMTQNNVRHTDIQGKCSA
jgi:hypothetical protein